MGGIGDREILESGECFRGAAAWGGSDSKREERGLSWVVVIAGGGKIPIRDVLMPFNRICTVMRSPNVDGVGFSLATEAGFFEPRNPIGTRTR